MLPRGIGRMGSFQSFGDEPPKAKTKLLGSCLMVPSMPYGLKI